MLTLPDMLRLKHHAMDHCFLLAQLVLQLCASGLILLCALPLHGAYILTRSRAVRRSATAARESYFITGASSGIGAALAVKLAARKQTRALHLAGRDEDRLQAVRRACRAVAVDNLRIHTVIADVVDSESMVCLYSDLGSL